MKKVGILFLSFLISWCLISGLLRYVPCDLSDVLFRNGMLSSYNNDIALIRNSADWRIQKDVPAETLLSLLNNAKIDRAVPGAQNDILYLTDAGIFRITIGEVEFSITEYGYMRFGEEYFRLLDPYSKEIWTYLTDIYYE